MPYDKPLEICVLEDEADLREEIVESLQDAGFNVRGFGVSRALYAALLQSPCDIVVLDVGLPEENGFSVAACLRGLGNVGIIMLTAWAQHEDQVYGLQQGADAYLVKPTDLRVLEATIISLARRLHKEDVLATAATTTAAMEEVVDKPWTLSGDGWTLLDPAGSTLSLTLQERIFLHCLIKQTGKAVLRNILIEALIEALGADADEYSFHRLDAMVNRLRKKALEQKINLPLRAVRGVGYLFVG